MLETPTVDQIHVYLLARGWRMGDSGAAAYLMVTMGHSVRMLHEPTEYDRGKAVFDIAIAEGRHPADVRLDILNGQPAPKSNGVEEQASEPSVRTLTVFLRQRRLDLGLTLDEVAAHIVLDVTGSLLLAYEDGELVPSLRELTAWADALGCDTTFTVRSVSPPRTRFDSLDELRQDMRDNAWARRVAAPAIPDDIEEIKQRIAAYRAAGNEEGNA